jgi:hypothetical protein
MFLRLAQEKSRQPATHNMQRCNDIDMFIGNLSSFAVRTVS